MGSMPKSAEPFSTDEKTILKIFKNIGSKSLNICLQAICEYEPVVPGTATFYDLSSPTFCTLSYLSLQKTPGTDGTLKYP